MFWRARGPKAVVFTKHKKMNYTEPLYDFEETPKPKRFVVEPIHDEVTNNLRTPTLSQDYIQLIRINAFQEAEIQQLHREIMTLRKEISEIQSRVIQTQVNCVNQLRKIGNECPPEQKRALMFEGHLLSTAIFRSLNIFQ